jgi:Cytochrome c oxidase subunit IV
VYAFTNKEFEGTPLLFMTAGRFILLALWALRTFRRTAREERAEAGGAGEPHVGPTIWPLALALSAIGLVLSVLVATWLYAIGGVLLVLALWGWFSDVKRQWRHHGGGAGAALEHADHG